MTVYVVMGNDFPDAAFSTDEAATSYCRARELAEIERNNREGRRHYARVYWRVYKFEVDKNG